MLSVKPGIFNISIHSCFLNIILLLLPHLLEATERTVLSKMCILESTTFLYLLHSKQYFFQSYVHLFIFVSINNTHQRKTFVNTKIFNSKR